MSRLPEPKKKKTSFKNSYGTGFNQDSFYSNINNGEKHPFSHKFYGIVHWQFGKVDLL